MKIKITTPLPLVIALCPLLVYAIVMPYIRLRDLIKKPRYLSFTTMDYLEWKLKWKYEADKKSEYYLIEEIHPICPACNCKLITIEYKEYSELYCPVCRDKTYRIFELHKAVKTVIEHKIETNNYP